MVRSEQDRSEQDRSGQDASAQDRSQRPVRIDVIDNWDRRWPQVLESLRHGGERQTLMLDADGWLSARQNVLVAFDDEDVVGHAAFHVEPIDCGTDGPDHRPCIEARMDAVQVKPGETDDLRRMLVEEARRRAEVLNCVRLVGFEA